MMAPELDRHSCVAGSTKNSRRVRRPAFKHPSAAIRCIFVSTRWPRSPAPVQPARRRVVEEDVVQPVAAPPFQPRWPVIVQRVIAHDQRPPRERGLLAIDPFGELPAGDEADPSRARFYPQEPDLFQQPVRRVQTTARAVSAQSHSGGVELDAEAVSPAIPGDNLNLTRVPGGRPHERQMAADLSGGERLRARR